MAEGNVIPFPVRPPRPQTRVEIIPEEGGVLGVWIACSTGENIICGSADTLLDALDIAREKAATLGGVQIVDFSTVTPIDRSPDAA